MGQMTATNTELTPEQQEVISKVEKLLRLAAANPSPEEAASAAAKAQALLVAYNLTSVEVSADADKSAVREKLKIKGGMYAYQRELWDAVARLNFCMHFNVAYHVVRKYGNKPAYDGKEFRHVLVGRVVNTRSTQVMAVYLEQAIERGVSERWSLNSQRFTREATAFREGAADHVVMRLDERRRKIISEERAKADKARASTSTHLALTIASHSEAEADANMDHMMGDGYSARQRAERQQRATARKAAEDAYTAWAAAHPAEAKKQADDAERRDRRSSRSYRSAGPTAREQRAWTTTYAQGWDTGAHIGIDPQAPNPSPSDRKRLT